MAQILLPDSDIAAGSWTATPLWSKVDDDSGVNPSGDGTTIASDNNTAPDNADLGLVSGTDPSSSTGHILRARWNKDASGGHAINAVLEVWQGTPGTGTLIATLTETGITEVETLSEYTLTGIEADSITDYSALNLRLSRQGDTGGSPNGRRSLVADLVEFEIPDAGASPVTVELVAATASATPQPLDLSLGAAATELVAATASLTAQALGVSLGATAVELAPATVTVTPQPFGLSLGAKSVELAPAAATMVAQVLGVDIAGSAVEVELTPATASLVAQSLGVTVDPLAIALTPATANLAPQTLGVSLGVKTVELTPAAASLVAQALGVDAAGASVTVELQPATITSVAQPLGVSLGALSVELSPTTATLVAQVLGVVVSSTVRLREGYSAYGASFEPTPESLPSKEARSV